MNINSLKKIINESYIKEVGDLKNIDSYPYYNLGLNKWGFKTDFGETVVMFSTFDPADWGYFEVRHNDYDYSQEVINVSYAIEDVTSQIQKTNYRELLKIVKTVSMIIKEYIEKNSPYSILLFGDDKMGSGMSDKQKNSLYLMTALQNLPTGYRISKSKIKDPSVSLEGYIIFKNK
jgi:hypothetical protein